ncbi:MAG: multicopper oxidase domain-containing protein, partial [Myxococcales bacterium]
MGANHPARVWTFNGTVPGPFLRVREGDTVVLKLTNDPSNVEPHSIDLHAVVGPDGGGAVTEVKPGESKTLTFLATRQGAYLYHCVAEHEPWEHIAYGMYGVILVEPPEGLPRVDHEYYVAQSEWYLTLASAEEHGEAKEEGGEKGEESENEASEPGSLGNVFVLDEGAARRAEPTLFTFNGHRQALSSDKLFGQVMRAQSGESVRVFFADAGPNMTSSFHVIGAIFDRVLTGHFEDATRNEETLSVPPGSAAVFEFSTPVPG